MRAANAHRLRSSIITCDLHSWPFFGQNQLRKKRTSLSPTRFTAFARCPRQRVRGFVRHTARHRFDANYTHDAVSVEPKHGARVCSGYGATARDLAKTSPYRLSASRISRESPPRPDPDRAPLPAMCLSSTSSPQVGLPDDELHRRTGIHRAVYGRYRDVTPNERTSYHIVPVSWFNAQLPIGTGADGFVTEDFHVLGGIEVFSDLGELLEHANEQLCEQRGYFYVLQLDFDEVGGDVRGDGDENGKQLAKNLSERKNLTPQNGSDSDTSITSNDSFVMLGNESDDVDNSTRYTLLRSAIDVDHIQRIYLATRKGENSFDGKFTNVQPP